MEKNKKQQRLSYKLDGVDVIGLFVLIEHFFRIILCLSRISCWLCI